MPRAWYSNRICARIPFNYMTKCTQENTACVCVQDWINVRKNMLQNKRMEYDIREHNYESAPTWLASYAYLNTHIHTLYT